MQIHFAKRKAYAFLLLFTLICTLFSFSVSADPAKVTVQLAVAGQNEMGFSFLSEPASVEVDAAAANVFGALQASGLEYEDMGGYVTSILGQAASGLDGWQFTVNDTLVSVGAPQAPIQDGDTVLWSYTKGSNDYLMPTWESMTKTKPANKVESDALVGDGNGLTLDADGTLLPLSTAPASITFASVGMGSGVLSQTFLTKDVPVTVKNYSITDLTGSASNLQVTLTTEGILAAPVDPGKPVNIPSLLVQVDGVNFRPTSVLYEDASEIGVQFAIAGQDENGFTFVTEPTPITISGSAHQTVLGTLDASGTDYEATDGYVTSIGGVAAEGADGWQYQVNDTLVSTGADKTVLHEGDTVLWVYSKASNGYLLPTWKAMTGNPPANQKQPDAVINGDKAVKLSKTETKLTLTPAPESILFASASASSEILSQSWMTPDEPLSLKTYTMEDLSGTDTNLQVTLKDGALYLSVTDKTKAVDVKQFSLQVGGVNYKPVAVSYEVPVVTPTPTSTPNHSGGGRPSGGSSGGTGGVVIAPTATPSATPGPSATPDPSVQVGSDVAETEWYYAPTMTLIGKNIIKGDADTGNVRPNDTITREEIASLLVSAYQLPLTPQEETFTDSTSSPWALDLLYTLKSHGIMNGDGFGMQGMQNAQRLDVVVMLARAAAISSENTSVLDQFTDSASIPEWARPAVAAMVEKGYLSGYDDGTLKLDQSILRCETFALVNRTAVI